MRKELLSVDTALLAPHTVVRRFREEDGAALYELIQDNDSRLSDDFPKTLASAHTQEGAEFFVRERLADWLMQREYCFGIWHNKDAKLIGMIRIFRIDWRIPRAEVGFFIDEGYSQQGLMTESLKVVLQFVFQQLKVEKLQLMTSMENIPSQRLARKVSFRREGDLRANFRKGSGELIDTMLFGLTRSEWLGI
jgi:RimJ/RimL family protein N-acetyltransferase